jgi:hypothetical protein
LSDFEDFFTKTQRTNELFSELLLENQLYLDNSRINEIRAKYDLALFDTDIDEPEDRTIFAESIFVLHSNIETKKEEFVVKSDFDSAKTEPEQNSDFDTGTAFQDDLRDQYSSDFQEMKEEKSIKRTFRKRKPSAKKPKQKKKMIVVMKDDSDKDYENTDKDSDYKETDIPFERTREYRRRQHELNVANRKLETSLIPYVCNYRD